MSETKKKYRIGYTTGAFDMFHAGHLAILKRAKEQCDYLIVGVSSDALIEQYKHKTPIVPLEDRMAIVGAIRYVDQVVVQENMDKLDLYRSIEEKLKAVGVDVVFLPHTPGVSTTILTEIIRRRV